MTKYQLDHFKKKVRRNFDPLIEEQELLVKQYRAEATEKIVGKLAKKMGADKILNEFKKAEAQLKACKTKREPSSKRRRKQVKTKRIILILIVLIVKKDYRCLIVKNN